MERRVDDYFEHVAKLDQDMAVEIIFQCGDKQFWEEARYCLRYNIHETIREKKKGRNQDLSVAAYKVQQELQDLHEVESEKQQVETSV
jgi:hypothetical protein